MGQLINNAVDSRTKFTILRTLPGLLPDFMLCAGSDIRKAHETPGDSGGPAFQRIWDEDTAAVYFELVGIFSGRQKYGDFSYYSYVSHPQVHFL